MLFSLHAVPWCQLCLERAVAYRPSGGTGLHPTKPVKSCAVRRGAQSIKCRHCERNGKPCESLPRKYWEVLSAFFPLQSQDWADDATYLADAAVVEALSNGRRALRQLRRGTPADRARSAAQAAAAAESRIADDFAARSHALAIESLKVQTDIANSLRVIAREYLAAGNSSTQLPRRVGSATLAPGIDDVENEVSEDDTDDSGDDAAADADGDGGGSAAKSGQKRKASTPRKAKAKKTKASKP
ncbi:hypothetical protein LRP88_02104 [Fusarium phalaenopsidis]